MHVGIQILFKLLKVFLISKFNKLIEIKILNYQYNKCNCIFTDKQLAEKIWLRSEENKNCQVHYNLVYYFNFTLDPKIKYNELKI